MVQRVQLESIDDWMRLEGRNPLRKIELPPPDPKRQGTLVSYVQYANLMRSNSSCFPPAPVLRIALSRLGHKHHAEAINSCNFLSHPTILIHIEQHYWVIVRRHGSLCLLRGAPAQAWLTPNPNWEVQVPHRFRYGTEELVAFCMVDRRTVLYSTEYLLQYCYDWHSFQGPIEFFLFGQCFSRWSVLAIAKIQLHHALKVLRWEADGQGVSAGFALYVVAQKTRDCIV